MSAHKPPSTRLSMPDPRPAIAGIGMVLLGAISVATRMEQWRDLGWALVVIGGFTAGWWASQAWRVMQLQRMLEKEAERKAALQASRRQKEEEERARRDADRKTKEEQTARLREQRLDESRKRKEAEEGAVRERAAREQKAEAEIARLKALDAGALKEEVTGRFQTRGYRVVPADGEANGLMLQNESGSAVCRIMAVHSGRAGDVQDLEAWRRDAGAREAFLVSMAGFAPGAVRAAQGKPITLVEPHLLASWESIASETSPLR